MFPGEQGQVDWAYFGPVMVGRAKRSLSCFVMTLSHSRALYLEFFFDQTMENFLRGHVHAFAFFGGQPRVILYDNLKSAVLERRGNHISFHPRLIELSAHYHFAPRPCQVRAGNQKGRVERAIRYVRESFWAGRTFTTLSECNRQAWFWRDQVAHLRPWPGGDLRTVSQVFEQERARLLPHAAHPFPTERIEPVRSAKTIYVRFDLNQYSIPPEAVGRQLTLAASDTHVRILDGANEIGRHTRSYDRGQLVLDPAHQDAVLKSKRKALASDLAVQLKHVGLCAVPDALDDFLARATKARWSPLQILEALAQTEAHERSKRSLERRLRISGIKSFKPMADFDWTWPTKIERDIIDRAFTLDFLAEARNLVLVGRNGLGKTMIAQNICHTAVLAGHSVLFRNAAALLEELHRQSPEGRRRKLRTYANVGLLCIDEVGYLSFDDKAADLLYEVVNRRYERKPLIVTTNRPFKEWNEVFPNATCIVTLLDRLLHHADVTVVEGNSYRVRESEQESTARRKKK
jgi:DNA replication protein DnaC